METAASDIHEHNSYTSSHKTHLYAHLNNTLGRGLFFGDTHDDIVPIGQNEHHVRGAYTNDRITPTTVVITIILQNTRPIAFQSPQAKYICTPNTTKIKYIKIE